MPRRVPVFLDTGADGTALAERPVLPGRPPPGRARKKKDKGGGREVSHSGGGGGGVLDIRPHGRGGAGAADCAADDQDCDDQDRHIDGGLALDDELCPPQDIELNQPPEHTFLQHGGGDDGGDVDGGNGDAEDHSHGHGQVAQRHVQLGLADDSMTLGELVSVADDEHRGGPPTLAAQHGRVMEDGEDGVVGAEADLVGHENGDHGDHDEVDLASYGLAPLSRDGDDHLLLESTCDGSGAGRGDDRGLPSSSEEAEAEAERISGLTAIEATLAPHGSSPGTCKDSGNRSGASNLGSCKLVARTKEAVRHRQGGSRDEGLRLAKIDARLAARRASKRRRREGRPAATAASSRVPAKALSSDDRLERIRNLSIELKKAHKVSARLKVAKEACEREIAKAKEVIGEKPLLDKLKAVAKLCADNGVPDVLSLTADALLSGSLPFGSIRFHRLVSLAVNSNKDFTNQLQYSDEEMRYFSVLKRQSCAAAVLEAMRGPMNIGGGHGRHSVRTAKVTEFAIERYEKQLEKNRLAEGGDGPPTLLGWTEEQGGMVLHNAGAIGRAKTASEGGGSGSVNAHGQHHMHLLMAHEREDDLGSHSEIHVSRQTLAGNGGSSGGYLGAQHDMQVHTDLTAAPLASMPHTPSQQKRSAATAAPGAKAVRRLRAAVLRESGGAGGGGMRRPLLPLPPPAHLVELRHVGHNSSLGSGRGGTSGAGDCGSGGGRGIGGGSGAGARNYAGHHHEPSPPSSPQLSQHHSHHHPDDKEMDQGGGGNSDHAGGGSGTVHHHYQAGLQVVHQQLPVLAQMQRQQVTAVSGSSMRVGQLASPAPPSQQLSQWQDAAATAATLASAAAQADAEAAAAAAASHYLRPQPPQPHHLSTDHYGFQHLSLQQQQCDAHAQQLHAAAEHEAQYLRSHQLRSLDSALQDHDPTAMYMRSGPPPLPPQHQPPPPGGSPNIQQFDLGQVTRHADHSDLDLRPQLGFTPYGHLAAEHLFRQSQQ
eukprot:SM000088S23719  [mRNA]  locus=s88:382270:386567:+ [translate_table: standard]